MALALSMVAGLATTIWQARVAGMQRDRAEKRFEEVRSLAKSVVFDLHDAINELPGSNAARKVLVDKALEYYNSLAAEMPDDPVLRQEMGRSYLRIGDVQGLPTFPNLGQSREAMVSFRRSAELAQLNVVACPDSIDYMADFLRSRHRIGVMFLTMGETDSARVVATINRQDAEEFVKRFPEEPLPANLLAVTCGLLRQLIIEAGDTLTAETLIERRIEACQISRQQHCNKPASRLLRNHGFGFHVCGCPGLRTHHPGEEAGTSEWSGGG